MKLLNYRICKLALFILGLATVMAPGAIAANFTAGDTTYGSEADVSLHTGKSFYGSYTTPGTAGTGDSLVVWFDDNAATSVVLLVFLYDNSFNLVDSARITTFTAGDTARYKVNLHSPSISASTAYYIGFNMSCAAGGNDMYYPWSTSTGGLYLNDTPPIDNPVSGTSGGFNKPRAMLFYHSGGGGGSTPPAVRRSRILESLKPADPSTEKFCYFRSDIP